jgi:hypothetical protein
MALIPRSGRPTLAALACALAVGASAGAVPGAVPAAPTILVVNAYYPKAGLEEQVYRLRLRASAVRARAGLVEGRVLRRLDGPAGDAPVLWEAEYADLAARERDVAALDANAEFTRIQAEMGGLVSRFERSVYRIAPPAAPVPD